MVTQFVAGIDLPKLHRPFKFHRRAALADEGSTHASMTTLYAFGVLALEGDDLRKLPLHLRKNNLARLLARRPEGIFVSEFEQGEIGPDLFRP